MEILIIKKVGTQVQKGEEEMEYAKDMVKEKEIKENQDSMKGISQ